MSKTWGVVLMVAGLALPSVALSQALTDDQVRQTMIEESIRSYPGNCPCPYNLASNGSRCGKRSAWSKPGGFDPLCYLEDIPATMVDDYRVRSEIPKPSQ